MFIVIEGVAFRACHQELDCRLRRTFVGIMPHLVTLVTLDGVKGRGLDPNFSFFSAPGCCGGCTVSHFLLGRFLSDVCEGDPIATCSDDL